VENIGILEQALPYIKQYRGKTFVIKMGGELLSEPECLDGLARDIALLYQLNIQVVLIHGGGPQLSEVAKSMGIESRKVGGRRITDDRMLEVAKMVFGGAISTDLLAALRRHDVPGVGLSGVDGDLIHATRRPPTKMFDEAAGKELEVDFQNVGDIESVDPKVLRVLLDKRFVPVVCSLGADGDGTILNINADTIACEIAVSLPAEKLFLLSNTGGVLADIDDPESRYSYLTTDRVDALIGERKISGGMIPKLQAAVGAVRCGVNRAHVINGKVKNAILHEVFTLKGLGTMVLDREQEATYLEQG